MDVKLAKLENVKQELDNKEHLSGVKHSLNIIEEAIREIAQELPENYTFAEVYTILTKS